ncbi:neurobeachin [Nilaparvata lugens]|uniref:neurobeachin n=1 Tax=Nilaparvata lugens TaxID=108931 RepID=UPI000B9862AB|nr:neurobeachin [Nilaparvata lugens]
MSEIKAPPHGELKRPEEVVRIAMEDNLKFGLLTAFIKVGQVSNRDLVNSVLHLDGAYMSPGLVRRY